ncbi:MAG: rSAM/selenodomain-associated transferase 1 [Lentimonas sp.]|jgi:rSAM/selenodomain-associated transferase 1
MPAILIFLKAPRRGHVKTRLAHTTGPERALQTYRALVERQWTELPTHGRIEVHYTPSDADFEMRQWLGHEHDYYPQSEGELGVRLQHSVKSAFERGAKTVYCIGGDCPKLDQPHFEQAEAALSDNCDVVFGPCEDGGYYLIGLNAPHPELFNDIPWSSRNTLDSSLKKAADLGLRVKLLETLYDIDEITELQRAINDGRLPPAMMEHE